MEKNYEKAFKTIHEHVRKREEEVRNSRDLCMQSRRTRKMAGTYSDMLLAYMEIECLCNIIEKFGVDSQEVDDVLNKG